MRSRQCVGARRVSRDRESCIPDGINPSSRDSEVMGVG